MTAYDKELDDWLKLWIKKGLWLSRKKAYCHTTAFCPGMVQRAVRLF